MSSNANSNLLEDGVDEFVITQSGLAGLITYQSASGIFGEAGFSRISTIELEVNGQTFDVDEDDNGSLFGLGYRIPRVNSDDNYWGIGLRRISVDDADQTSLRLFSEKDSPTRYGIVELSYDRDDGFDAISVRGRHIWFSGGVVGLGVAWGLQAGEFDSSAMLAALDSRSFELGVILMFRR